MILGINGFTRIDALLLLPNGYGVLEFQCSYLLNLPDQSLPLFVNQMLFGCVACEAWRHIRIKLPGVFIIRYNFKAQPNSNYQAPWSILTWPCPFFFFDLYDTIAWTLFSKDVIIDILYICFQIAITWLFHRKEILIMQAILGLLTTLDESWTQNT